MIGAFSIALGIVGAIYWQPIVRCVGLGLSTSKAIDIRYKVLQADKVEILLLQDDWQKPATNGLYIAPYERFFAINDSRTVDGTQAEKISSLWSQQVFDPMIQALCHDPAYGLRFMKDDTLLWETSICFKCNNFTLECGPHPNLTTFMGFDSRTEEAKQLLSMLKEILPLKKTANMRLQEDSRSGSP